MRTPSLPLGVLNSSGHLPQEFFSDAFSRARVETSRASSRSRLRELLQDKAIREAITLASPDLASRAGLWMEERLEGEAALRVEQALLRYLIRMSSRSTPFGLFAGVSIGGWESTSQLMVAPWSSSRKVLRLDWGEMEKLVDRLSRDPKVRASLQYRVNSSLHACAGWYRFIGHRDHHGQDRSYHLEAVEASPHLDFVIDAARKGVGLEELTVSLAQFAKVELEVASSYLDRLIESQVICGNLQPGPTCPEPLEHVAKILGSNPSTILNSNKIAALTSELKAVQSAPLGAYPDGYANQLPSLTELGTSLDSKDLVQVDLFRPAPGLALSSIVRRALEEGAETLRRLTPPPKENALDRFRTAFQDRYQSRWVPLLDVLDEESGIGFDGAPAMDSPLLEDLSFQTPLSPQQVTSRDYYLLSQVSKWCGSQVLELTKADIQALSNPEPPVFSASFSALVALSAPDCESLDRGEFTFWMEHYSGPTAARWLGRFASGDPTIEASLRKHLRKEENSRPDVIFAEVIHVPEGRMGNILARPMMRDHEIPFLSNPSTTQDCVINPSDLLVTVRGNRVHLFSVRAEREVVPRLASAHNFSRGPVVYRFLAHLQHQDGRPGGWSWGVLAGQPFLPRLMHGHHVISKARWKIEAKELKQSLTDSAEGAWGAFQLIRERRRLPRFVVLSDADNNLLIDLDQPLWVETLHHLVASRSSFILTESFPAPNDALVNSSDGRFAHELVIPFEADQPIRMESSQFPLVVNESETRVFPPGSEWLYIKLYCGPASSDRLLMELEPLLRVAKKQGLWDRWHFLRYRDPSPHLRLRFHGLPFRLLAELLPLLRKHLEAYLTQGLLWKWQVETFEPELERYGGSTGFKLAESWFFEDSQYVLTQLTAGMNHDKRWRTGLKDTDAIWAALGFSVRERGNIALTAREAFRKEFDVSGQSENQVGKKFRRFRKELEVGFPGPQGLPSRLGLAGLPPIRSAFEEGSINGDLASIAGSLSHMHLNRVFHINQRENEWILTEFLTRLYESALARAPTTPGNKGVEL